MSEIIQTVFGLLGGLAIFIYGMNMMSDYLQKVAGDRMKRILGALTRNAFMGVIAGALCTAVLQSSSATTVMAIGFVSAGLMSRRQAVSVILGANIGTTITAQIIAFKITDYVLVFVFVGFVLSFLGRKETIRDLGMTILAFGLLFLGIETMGGAMKPLANSEFFLGLISSVADNRFLGLLTGAFMTLVVQSSSATIAVLQNFASTPMPDGVTSVMGLAGALPVLLGDNIGTTITALMASVGQSKEAKRVAVSHCLFNISGALLFIWFITPYAALITAISPTGPEVEVIARQIANAHTGFNVIMTCIWLPLIGVLCKLSAMIVRDKGQSGPQGIQVVEALSNPVFLDHGHVGQPALAMQLIAEETVRAGQIMVEGLGEVADALAFRSEKELEHAGAKVTAGVELIDKINAYQVEMYSRGSLNESQVTRTAQIMCMLGDMERVGLLADDVVKAIQKGICLEKAAQMAPSLRDVRDMLSQAVNALSGDQVSLEALVLAKEKLLRDGMDLRKEHVISSAGSKESALAEKPFNGVIHDVDRMGNSCINIAEAALGKVDMGYFVSVEAPSEEAECA
ncbi:MAG: Na/Pi cotransporter family protein [Coriobacteriia bacterium]|nr:Na/Pi cotransporter family protein [Coriobacteriia bacterium]